MLSHGNLLLCQKSSDNSTGQPLPGNLLGGDVLLLDERLGVGRQGEERLQRLEVPSDEVEVELMVEPEIGVWLELYLMLKLEV